MMDTVKAKNLDPKQPNYTNQYFCFCKTFEKSTFMLNGIREGLSEDSEVDSTRRRA